MEKKEKRLISIDEFTVTMAGAVVALVAGSFSTFLTKEAFSREIEIRASTSTNQISELKAEIKELRQDIKSMSEALGRAMPKYKANE